VSNNFPARAAPLVQTLDRSHSSRTAGFDGVFLGYPFFPSYFAGDDNSNVIVSNDLRTFVINDRNLGKNITDFLEETNLFCMPFIPRQDLHAQLSKESSQLSSSEILLLACIKILCLPVEGDARAQSNPPYLAIKTAFVSAEVNGVLTVRLLQALVVLSIYEYCHGIYPSAYITLGTCTRYLAALGINRPSLPSEEPIDWIDTETRRRLWWAIYTMER
jgi:hypothetical protein